MERVPYASAEVSCNLPILEVTELRNVCLYSAMASQIWRVTALGIMSIQAHVHHTPPDFENLVLI